MLEGFGHKVLTTTPFVMWEESHMLVLKATILFWDYYILVIRLGVDQAKEKPMLYGIRELGVHVFKD